jgi:hypothetical protein
VKTEVNSGCDRLKSNFGSESKLEIDGRFDLDVETALVGTRGRRRRRVRDDDGGVTNESTTMKRDQRDKQTRSEE